MTVTAVMADGGRSSGCCLWECFWRLSLFLTPTSWLLGSPGADQQFRYIQLWFRCRRRSAVLNSAECRCSLGGLLDPWGGATGLLWTSVLYAAGGPSVRSVSGRGRLQPSVCHVLFHDQLGGLRGLLAALAGLESRSALRLPGRPGRVPLHCSHPHLHLQRPRHHEGVRGTHVRRRRPRGDVAVPGAGLRRAGWRPVRRAALLLLPAQVQTEAPEVRTPSVSAENVLVHDPSHLQELLPRAAGDEAAVRGAALQLDGRHVFHALLHGLCGGSPVRGCAQRFARKCAQAKIRGRSVLRDLRWGKPLLLVVYLLVFFLVSLSVLPGLVLTTRNVAL